MQQDNHLSSNDQTGVLLKTFKFRTL